MRLLASLLLLTSLTPLSGCCSLARLFCGPETREWVSVDFSTPRKTVQTLAEAFRRDDAEVAYLCFSNSFCKQNGLDKLTAELAWQQLREQNPGMHLVGYATIPEPTRLSPATATCELDVEGTGITLRLVRQSRWQVRYRRPNGTAGEQGRTREGGDLRDLASLEVLDGDEDRSRITLAPMTFYHEGLEEVPRDAIEFAGISQQWKVAGLKIEP